jgi:hypothetical protein
MSRWAKAFRTTLARHDTVDTADTSSRGRLVIPESVNSVSSVIAGAGGNWVTAPANAGQVSQVSEVSRSLETPKVDAARGEQVVVFDQAVPSGHLGAALRRPPSWADPAAPPSRGCFCSCCKGRRWWRECEVPKGWRCSACHPRDQFPADAVMEVTT